MTAVLVSDATVRDADAFQEYRTRATAAITRHGGTYLARGGGIEPLEGTRHPRNIIIVEFPTIEPARAWYSSPEYALPPEVRDKALIPDALIVDSDMTRLGLLL